MNLNNLTITELVAEVKRVNDTKKDLILDTRHINTVVLDGEPCIELVMNDGTKETFSIEKRTQQQIAQRSKIPGDYARRMFNDAPELFAENVNYWHHKQPSERMLRTIEGKARAFLSNRYMPVDNWDVLSVILPELTKYRNDHGNDAMRVHQCSMSNESSMNMKIVFPNITRQVAHEIFKDRGAIVPGQHHIDNNGIDEVCGGVFISNSEDGGGSVKIEPFVYRLICNNGLIAEGFGQRKHHVGKLNATDDDGATIYADDTLQADRDAFLLKCRDAMRNVVDENLFDRMIRQINIAANREFDANPPAAIRMLASKTGMSEDEMELVLNAFITEPMNTQWGLVNAITAAGKMIDDVDRSNDFEKLGGKALFMSDADFREISTAI